MTTTSTTPTAVIAVVDPQFSDAERYALGAFLAGYRGQTRDAYALDLRQFVAWCEQHELKLFAVRRADIECFARDLEECGRATTPGARLPGAPVAASSSTGWMPNVAAGAGALWERFCSSSGTGRNTGSAGRRVMWSAIRSTTRYPMR